MLFDHDHRRAVERNVEKLRKNRLLRLPPLQMVPAISRISLAVVASRIIVCEPPACERAFGSESLNSASTVLPRLLLLRISLFHAPLINYSLIELTSSLPTSSASALDPEHVKLETTSLLSSTMSSNSPTEVFTTSNVFLDVLVKAGITHAFVKYVPTLSFPHHQEPNPFSYSLGSDHPALLEAFISRQKYKLPTLKIITCPNEVREMIPAVSLFRSADCVLRSSSQMVALSCAQGYAQVCGKPAAVLVHVVSFARLVDLNSNVEANPERPIRIAVHKLSQEQCTTSRLVVLRSSSMPERRPSLKMENSQDPETSSFTGYRTPLISPLSFVSTCAMSARFEMGGTLKTSF